VRKRDAQLNDLLARGRLSAPQRERIWARLSWTSRAREVLSWKALRLGLPVSAAGIVIVLLVARFVVDRQDAFVAKGGARSIVEVDCDRGSLGACPTGSRLIFRHARVTRPAYLEAYTDPLGRTGERVWYYPARAGTPPRLDAADSELLRDAIVLGPEHTVGDYEIHVIVSTRPLERREAMAPDDAATIIERAVIPLKVVRR